MSTEYYNSQWQMPNEANKSKQANYSMVSTATSKRIPVSGLANNLGITDQITMSGWMKPTTGVTQNNQYAFGFIGVNGNNGFDFGFHGATCGSYANFSSSGYAYTNTAFTYADGNWHHFIVSYNGSKHKIYIDGVFKAENSRTGNLVLGGDFYMFNAGTSNNNGGTGELVDVCVFDYALSDGGVSVGSTATGQIAKLYGNGLSLPNPMSLSSAPKAYYKLSDSVWNGSSYITPNNAVQDYVFDFSGALGESVITTSFYMPTSNFTVSLWFKHTMGTRDNYMFAIPKANNSTTSFWIYTLSGNVRATVSTTANGNADCEPNVTVNDGKWHQIIATWDSSGNLKCFIDGANETISGQSPKSGTVAYGDNIGIGGYWTSAGSGSTAFDGEISNVLVLDTVLTATEVQTLYNYGSPIQTLANIPQSSNLKAWYKLDASEIYNSSITDWEVNNALSPWTSSLNFSSNDTINLGNDSSLRITTAMSVSCWIKITDSGQNTIVGRELGSGTGRDWKLYLVSGIIYFWCSANGTASDINVLSSSSTVNDGNWHNLTAVNNGTNQYIYIDGVLNNSNSGGQTINASTANNYIGSRNGTGFFFNGSISNVQIFNTALTDGTGGTVNQIETLYNSGNPLTDMSSFSSLVSWWKLNNTTTGIEDSKGSNDGTNNGATEAPGSVSTLNGLSSGMSQTNLVQSDLQTVAPYSRYAMNFDAGNSDYIDLTSQIVLTSELTISCWVKSDGAVVYGITAGDNGSADSWYRFYPAASGGNRVDIMIDGTSTEWNFANGGTPIQNGVWQHYLLKRDSNNKWTFYLDNVKYTTNQPTISGSFRVDTFCRIYSTYPRYFEGAMSNMAIWNTSLSDSQVREVYNKGLPSDLNSFSGTAPIHWWQLGEGSSYAGGWIFADEIGSINGEGQNIAETDLTNGVGTTANGVSNGMSEGNLVGDAPYSTANALSTNMAVTARVTGSGNTP